MKGIVLWDPWATLMSMGLKCIETRSWATRHRGDLAICAAKREPDWQFLERFPVLAPLLETRTWFHPGCVLCVVDLHECISTSFFKPTFPDGSADPEAQFGNYDLGRWAWCTSELRVLKQPVPVVGRQGLFNLPAADEAAVRAQLPGGAA